MKLSNFLKSLLPVVLMIFAVSCEKTPVAGEKSTEDVSISLDIDKLSLSTVNVRVRHDGPADLNWVYMLTQDLVADADELIDAEVARTIELTGKIVAYVGQNKSIQMADLQPKSFYRFICKSLDPQTGVPVGEAVDIQFRTSRDPSVFEINSNWTVTKGSRKVDPTDKVEYDNFICESTDEESYVLLPIKVSDFEYYYNGEIRSLFEDYVNSFGLKEGDSKWRDIVRSGNVNWSEQRLRSGEWIVFMIGIDPQGELTGLYQELSLTIEQEIATADYEKWLGTWMVSDKNGNNLFEIVLIQSENNMWYLMGGWESTNIYQFDTYDPNLMPEVFFDKESGNIAFVSQWVNTMYTDTDVTDFYFSGTFTYGNSYVLGSDVLNYRMAEAKLRTGSEDSAVIEGCTFVTQGVEFPIESICYIYYIGSSLGSISLSTPTLPLTMTRVTE